MKLISIGKHYLGCCLPKTWVAFYCVVESGFHIGLTFHLPYIFHGPWYDHFKGYNRYGWRIPRFLIEFSLAPCFKFNKWPEGSSRVYKLTLPSFYIRHAFWYDPF